jgi:hypothetical protein
VLQHGDWLSVLEVIAVHLWAVYRTRLFILDMPVLQVTRKWRIQNSLHTFNDVSASLYVAEMQIRHRYKKIHKYHQLLSSPDILSKKNTLFIFPYSMCRQGSSVERLTTGWTVWDRIPVSRIFSAPVQTDPGAKPASCKMDTVSFPGVKCGRSVLLTTHPLLLPRTWKSRAVPLPNLWTTQGL